jgi:uncharacterized membrane protein YidH (DUF202 family)
MFKNKTLVAVMMGAFLLVAPLVSPLLTAKADNLICTVFPFIKGVTAFGISTLCDEGGINAENTSTTIRSTFNLIVSLIFVAIIIFSIYVIIKAAIKYIRSEGDPAKIEEAQKAIKSVFIGIAALFVGLIGIIIVIAFFGAGGALNSDQNAVNTSPLLNSILNGN